MNTDKMNTQAKLLKKFYENVVNSFQKNGDGDSSVMFVEIESLDDIVKSDIVSKFETVIVDLKEFNQNVCMHIINSVLNSTKEQNAGVFIFPTEASQFEVLSFLRSHKLTLADNLKVFPVLFQKHKDGSDTEVTENITFGLAFGKIVVSNPPFKILLGDKKHLSTVVAQLTVPASSVALVTDAGLPIIQVHTERLLHRVTYFGTSKELVKFKQALAKDRVMYNKGVSVSDKEIVAENDQTKADGVRTEEKNNKQSETRDVIESSAVGDDVDESSTSPFKKDVSGVMNDSGIDFDGGAETSLINFGAGSSSIKKLDFDYSFTE